MSLSLYFGNGGHFRLKWRFLLISLSTNFYCIIWPWKPWYRAPPYDCSITILRVMAQFINFGNGGHFRLKKGFPQGWFWLIFFWRDLACQRSHWTPNLLFIKNVRVHVNSYWTIWPCTSVCYLFHWCLLVEKMTITTAVWTTCYFRW